MYVKFQKTYYGYNNRDVIYRGISCTRSIRSDRLFSPNESIKSAIVDICIEFECKENIPLNTTAYCLIIHDRMIEYNPLTNVIRKIV